MFKKTYSMSADSHVEIDFRKGLDGTMILTIYVEENPDASKAEGSEVKAEPVGEDPVLYSLEYYLARTRKAGLLDENNHWVKGTTQPQIALWVDLCAQKLGIANKWAWGFKLWGVKHLGQIRNKAINETGVVIGEDKIFACFEH